jgi:hypothetical protein
MRRWLLVPALTGFLMLAGCGGSSAKPATSTTSGAGTGPVTLLTIQMSPSNASIAQGTTQAFTATGNYSDGSTKDLTATAQWSCLLPTLATVSNISPTQGLATGVAPGTALITASSGSVSNSAQLNVTAATATSLAITPANPTIGIGNQQQFTATATFNDGSTQDVTSLTSWSSFPPFITSNSGLAIGQAPGVNTITAIFGGALATTNLTVDLSNLVSISVLPSNPSIANHTQTQFSVIGTFYDGSTRDVSSQAAWSSSNPAVANFPSTPGLAKSTAVGTTNISASVGTLNAASTLNVTAAQLQSITVSPVNGSIAPSTKLNYTAIGLFSDSTTQDLTTLLTWTVTDTSVASILTVRGTATAVSGGSTTVNATSPLTMGSIQGSAPLNVSSATLNSISVMPPTTFIPPGGTLNYSATGSFSDGSTQDVSALEGWSSSSQTVATVSSNAVTGQGVGLAIITAKLDTIPGTANLSVISPSQISLAVAPATAQIAGQTYTQLAVTGTYIDGSTQDFTTIANWTSSAPSVATVGYQTGIVSGLTPGTATITATIGTVTSTMQVTVTSATLTSITLSPANPSIAVGNSQQFTASGNFSDGSTQTLWGANWSSSLPPVAVVAASGLATSTGSGTSAISATVNGMSGSTNLTVQ